MDDWKKEIKYLICGDCENFHPAQIYLTNKIIEIIESIASDMDKIYKKETKEICICSAVETTDGVIVRGHRHGDCMVAINNMGKKVGMNQGFITSKNRFVDRKTARKLQEEAEIKSSDKDGYRHDTLFSEDLY